MADFSQSITNSVQCFSEGPSTKWGDANGYPYTMAWGVSTWGEGYSLPVDFIKVIDNSVVSDTTIMKEVVHIWGETVTIQAFEATVENLTQGIWYYVFPDRTTNAEDRDFATWTSATVSDVTFTCGAAGSTSWSEV